MFFATEVVRHVVKQVVYLTGAFLKRKLLMRFACSVFIYQTLLDTAKDY